MGTLKTFLDSKGIKPEAVVTTSKRIEMRTQDDRALAVARVQKRRLQKDKTYAELNIKKPALGRGVTLQALTLALKDTPVSVKVRSKILRSVNTILTAKKQPAADMKALFEGQPARVGKKPEEKKAAAGPKK